MGELMEARRDRGVDHEGADDDDDVADGVD